MLMRQSFSGASSAVSGLKAARDPGAKKPVWIAWGSGKMVRTGELSNTPDASAYRISLHIVAWLEKFFARCTEGHVARAAKGNFWPWP